MDSFRGPLSIKTVLRGDSDAYSMHIDSPTTADTGCAFFQHGLVKRMAFDATAPIRAAPDAPDRPAPTLSFLRGYTRAAPFSGICRDWSRVVPANCAQAVLKRRPRPRSCVLLISIARSRLSIGQTPHAYVTALRLAHARASLERGATVADTADGIGFSNRPAFTLLNSQHRINAESPLTSSFLPKARRSGAWSRWNRWDQNIGFPCLITDFIGHCRIWQEVSF